MYYLPCTPAFMPHHAAPCSVHTCACRDLMLACHIHALPMQVLLSEDCFRQLDLSRTKPKAALLHAGEHLLEGVAPVLGPRPGPMDSSSLPSHLPSERQHQQQLQHKHHHSQVHRHSGGRDHPKASSSLNPSAKPGSPHMWLPRSSSMQAGSVEERTSGRNGPAGHSGSPKLRPSASGGAGAGGSLGTYGPLTTTPRQRSMAVTLRDTLLGRSVLIPHGRDMHRDQAQHHPPGAPVQAHPLLGTSSSHGAGAGGATHSGPLLFARSSSRKRRNSLSSASVRSLMGPTNAHALSGPATASGLPTVAGGGGAGSSGLGLTGRTPSEELEMEGPLARTLAQLAASEAGATRSGPSTLGPPGTASLSLEERISAGRTSTLTCTYAFAPQLPEGSLRQHLYCLVGHSLALRPMAMGHVRWVRLWLLRRLFEHVVRPA